MKIVLLSPYFGGSHQRWAEQLQLLSKHEIQILSLPARHWKWRMHGAAITLAKQLLLLEEKPELIIATDMLDLSLFLALTRRVTYDIPNVLYFHENQLTYPWSPDDTDTKTGRDRHYGFINYQSALAADQVIFNSNYHRHDFLNTLEQFLSVFPDFQNLETINDIGKKSMVLSVGIERPPAISSTNRPRTSDNPCLLWNHRWEYDKNPDLFFKTLARIKGKGIPFELMVLGKAARKIPPIFEWAKKELSNEIIHFGYCESREQYFDKLTKCDIIPVTSNQDFFGISVVESIAAGSTPLLPNRLAYPEHIPEEHHKTLIYEDEDDFEEKLIHLIQRKSPFFGLQEHISKYFLDQVIEEYDKVFSAAVASKKST